MSAATSSVRWAELVDARRRDDAAGLLADLFERWARHDEAYVRGELAAIVRDPGDGSVLAEWRRTFEVDREAFRDVARNWTEDFRKG